MLTKEKWIRYCKALHEEHLKNPDKFLIPKSYGELTELVFVDRILTVAKIKGFDITFNN